MHPCLRVDEILIWICSFLESCELLQLALTCKSFTEPALRTLWRELNLTEGNPGPLTCLIPDEIRQSYWSEDHFYPTRRATDNSHWLTRQNLKYLAYVRNAEVVRGSFSNATARSLEQAFRNTSLFPNLEGLRYHRGPFSFLKILLAPSLAHLFLRLHITELDRDTIKVFSLMGIACPSITEFSCTVVIPYPNFLHPLVQDLSKSLAKAVSHWKDLNILSLPALDIDTFDHLSRLHIYALKLQSLPGIEYTRRASPSGLESLGDLDIIDWPLSAVVDFLESTETPMLESVEVTLPINDIPTAEQWKTYFDSIAHHSTTTPYLSISVNLPEDDGPLSTADEFFVSGDVLRPLVAAGTLGYLDLDDFPFFLLTDSLIEDLAKSSPHLTLLQIGARFPSRGKPTLTLNAFTHLLHHCPDIESVGLAMDMSSARELLNTLPVKESTQLRNGDFQLFVGHVEAKEPEDIAAFLAGFFYEPIEDLYVAYGSPHDEAWGLVKEKMAVLTEERRDGRQKLSF